MSIVLWKSATETAAWKTPTLSMIVDREKEIESFVPEKYWQISLLTEKAGQDVEARHTNGRFLEKPAPDIFLNFLENFSAFVFQNISDPGNSPKIFY